MPFFKILNHIVKFFYTFFRLYNFLFVLKRVKQKEPPRPPIKRTRWQKIKKFLADCYWAYRPYYHAGNALRKKAWKNLKIFVRFVYIHYYLFIRNYTLVRYPILWYSFFVIFWIISFYIFSKYFFAFVVGFNIFDLLVSDIFVDTVTVYAFSLLELHHAIMWYIFLVLGVVCWSIFGIVRDFSWRKPSLKFDLPVIYLFSTGTYFFFYIESFFLYFFFKAAYVFGILFFNVFEVLYLELYFYLLTWFTVVYMKVFEQIHSAVDLDEHTECIRFLHLHYIDFFVYSWLVGKKWFLNGLRGRSFFRGLNLSFSDVLLLNAEKRLDSSFFRPISKAEDFNDSISQALASNRFKHSVVLELVWAGFPLFIIYSMLLPSLILLYSMDVCLDPAFSVKVIGNQWYWSYEVSGWLSNDVNFFLFDHKFDSVLVQEDDLLLGQKRLLEVDNTLILPVNTIIRFLVTSSDVLHSWSLGEAGVKVDAVPGRLNQAVTWFCKPGVFYGQCSELCGVGHAFMPISVEVCSLNTWINYISEVSDFVVSPCDYTLEGLYLNIYELNNREWSFQIFKKLVLERLNMDHFQKFEINPLPSVYGGSSD